LIIVGGLKEVFIGKFRVKNYLGVNFFMGILGGFWVVLRWVEVGGIGGW
jgi:hypothetical protein